MSGVENIDVNDPEPQAPEPFQYEEEADDFDPNYYNAEAIIQEPRPMHHCRPLCDAFKLHIMPPFMCLAIWIGVLMFPITLEIEWFFFGVFCIAKLMYDILTGVIHI